MKNIDKTAVIIIKIILLSAVVIKIWKAVIVSKTMFLAFILFVRCAYYNNA